MSKELSKSPEMLQKEAKIKTLKKQLKKRKSVLKGLKTRLENTKRNIHDIQVNFHGQMLYYVRKMDDLRKEVVELAQKLQKEKWIGPQDRLALGAIVSDFTGEQLFGEGYAAFKNYEAETAFTAPNFDENYRAKYNDVFKEFQETPSEEIQKDIKKVYLNLSRKFHPDRAENEQQARQYHDLMQQINEAYQNNDIQVLLELERLYSTQAIDIETKMVTVNVLQKEIERLEREIKLINNQIERTSKEIKNLRKSDMGKMLTNYKKAEAEGEGLDAMKDQAKYLIDLLTQMKEGFQDSLNRKEISPKLIELMMNDPDFMEEDMLEKTPEEELIDLLQKVIEGDVDALDIMGEEYDYEIGIENPTFPINSVVRIKNNIAHPYIKDLDIQGWQGRVQDATREDRETIVYEIEWDSLAMLQLPQGFIESTIDNDWDFQTVYIEKQHLEAAPPRDTKENAFAIYRTLNHRYAWHFLPDAKQRQRLKKLLLFEPEQSDAKNWTYFFEKNLSYPFEAKTRGIADLRKGLKIKVLGLEYYDGQEGHIMSIFLNNRRFEHPLSDLKGVKSRGKIYQILEDYDVWVERTLRVSFEEDFEEDEDFEDMSWFFESI